MHSIRHQGTAGLSALALGLALAAVLVTPLVAEAAISVSRAELNGTQLRVEGTGAAPLSPISVDGMALGTSDGVGAFKLQQDPFASSTCNITVSDGISSTQATLSGCTPSSGGSAGGTSANVLLLSLQQTVPLLATLDNPCTPASEAIAFTGATRLTEEVWQMASGNLRLILQEDTSIQGRDTLLLGGPRYAADGPSSIDLELAPGSVSVFSFKKVLTEAADDNFHTVLVMVFDPSTLNIQVGLAGACDSGQP